MPSVAPATGSDGAWRVAATEFREAEPTWISFAPGEEVVVRFRQAAEVHPNGRTFVRVTGGRVSKKTDALAAAPSRRLLDNLYRCTSAGRAGMPHRRVLVMVGGTPAILMITGVLLWLRRSRRVRYTPATETFSKTSDGTRLDEYGNGSLPTATSFFQNSR